MSELKIGDRVHVEFDGEVVRADRVIAGGLICVRNSDSHFWVRAEHCTKITPPVKVGDILHTIREVDELPNGAVVISRGNGAGWRGRDGWYLAGELPDPKPSSYFLYPVRVLDLPEGN